MILLRRLLVIAVPLLPAAFAQAAMPLPGGGVPTLAPMLVQVTPAVVNISVMARDPAESNPLLQDPFFRRFFNIPDQPRGEQSAGSGVIVDRARGYVLTNNHVINNAQEVVVTLKDRRTFKARLIGTDPGTDVAVLKIDAHKLATVAAHHHHEQVDHGEVLSVSFAAEIELDYDRFDQFLQGLPDGVFRAKGTLAVHGISRRVIFHRVGGRNVLDQGAVWGEQPRSCRAVFLGQDFDRNRLLAQFRDCAAQELLPP